MEICGIIAEYNPFHFGHAHHIAETRKILGEDTAIVCAMSGNYVQRGEAALLPKHERARAAVQSGADLIIELPAAFSLRSAEGFAQAGVTALTALGVAKNLSFGAECAHIETLQKIAALLLERETITQTLHLLKTGISYAAAREKALYQQIQEESAIVGSPNNILAIEYLKAISRQNAPLSPLAVQRWGPGHDSGYTAQGMASASHIRRLVRRGDWEGAAPLLPSASRTTLQEAIKQNKALTDTFLLDNMMAAALARITIDHIARLPDIAEGLEHRLYAAIRSNRGFDAIAEAAKTKRYPLSRIRRLLFCAFLDITAEDSREEPQYIRVLAANNKGRQVLALARKQATLPILTKPAHVKRLSPKAQRQFERETLACDLYHIALGENIPFGIDWRAHVAL